MKRIFNYYIATVLLSVSVAACNFLDEVPESVINSATFYKTESDAVAATNAIYDYLTVGTEGIFERGFGGVFFNDYWVFKDVLSDKLYRNDCITGISYTQ
ncbi:MAG: RagB/SusD domain-containing protein [Bacteroidetes bacterium OLB12]|nr:MAG: RagB/SusD domain-containing protein [Bacteroidetes bacterium OLB12]